MTPEGRRVTKLEEILLNGNNIAMLIPGGEYPECVYMYILICAYRYCICAFFVLKNGLTIDIAKLVISL